NFGRPGVVRAPRSKRAAIVPYDKCGDDGSVRPDLEVKRAMPFDGVIGSRIKIDIQVSDPLGCCTPLNPLKEEVKNSIDTVQCGFRRGVLGCRVKQRPRYRCCYLTALTGIQRVNGNPGDGNGRDESAECGSFDH